MKRPTFIAEQARYARGFVGKILASIMALETHGDNLAAVLALDIKPTDIVLDIGTGHGRILSKLSDCASQGLVVGLDPSGVMVRMASQKNKRLIDLGRVQVLEGVVERLPFDSEFFDRIMAVHVMYFWPDIESAFMNIWRILKPGGRLTLVFKSSDDSASTAKFPAHIYTFHSCHAVENALRHTGFMDITGHRTEQVKDFKSRAACILTADKPCLISEA